ncbi:MAG: MoaD/ThiS family protein [Thermoprotei archaeon]
MRYFARVKEVTERAFEAIELPAGSKAGALVRAILDRYSMLKPEMSDGAGWLSTGYRLLVNGVPASSDLLLKEGDEVAVIPPVSGG